MYPVVSALRWSQTIGPVLLLLDYFPGPVISNLAHAGPSPVIFSLAHVGIQYYTFIITLECTVSAYLKKKVCEAECLSHLRLLWSLHFLTVSCSLCF